MRNNSLQKFVTTGRFTLPVIIIIAIACWLVAYVVVPVLPEKEGAYPYWQIFTSMGLPAWIDRGITLLLYIIIGYFLIALNNAFALIRVRASVQTLLYLIFVTVCPAMHLFASGDVGAISLLIALYFLFRSYQQGRKPSNLLFSFISIGIGSLFFPQLMWVVPILFIGAINVQSLNIRSFFAAVIGWSIPYWFLFGHAYFYEQMDLFYRPFREMVTFTPIDFTRLAPWEIATLAVVFVLFIISSINSFANSYKDKIRTRVFLRFLILLNIYIFIIILLQPALCMDFLSLLLISESILVGHFFALTGSRGSNFLFILTLLCFISLYIFNLWTLS